MPDDHTMLRIYALGNRVLFPTYHKVSAPPSIEYKFACSYSKVVSNVKENLILSDFFAMWTYIFSYFSKLVIAGPTSTSSYYEHDGDVDKQRHLYQPAIKELVKMSSVKYLDISYLPYVSQSFKNI